VLVSGPDEFAGAFAAMAKAQAQAVIIQGLFDPHRVALIDLAAKHRLALMSGSRDTTAAGGLVSISANFTLIVSRLKTLLYLMIPRMKLVCPRARLRASRATSCRRGPPVHMLAVQHALGVQELAIEVRKRQLGRLL
jgi:hypothetical protein